MDVPTPQAPPAIDMGAVSAETTSGESPGVEGLIGGEGPGGVRQPPTEMREPAGPIKGVVDSAPSNAVAMRVPAGDGGSNGGGGEEATAGTFAAAGGGGTEGGGAVASGAGLLGGGGVPSGGVEPGTGGPCGGAEDGGVEAGGGATDGGRCRSSWSRDFAADPDGEAGG